MARANKADRGDISAVVYYLSFPTHVERAVAKLEAKDTPQNVFYVTQLSYGSVGKLLGTFRVHRRAKRGGGLIRNILRTLSRER